MAVDEFYLPASEDKPRNSEGWEAKALLGFYEAKMKAREAFEKGPPPIAKGSGSHSSTRHSRQRKRYMSLHSSGTGLYVYLIEREAQARVHTSPSSCFAAIY
jgi:calcium homeostasis ER protein